ncbi:hypothetical protein [Enterococcus sp. BWR-S5]|uniref:hypothetical protein n=1 Tax=Enterococcus sp. BWR-S5 TaxID=2787714 RepID=UPI001920F7AB|nr:hypothetical protein [Enterococcus sp. BWR-S5]MBL1227221.1 hypothetical protein [Enterococcus sp. BWR-S5]
MEAKNKKATRSNRKAAVQITGICTALDISKEAITVKTYDKRVWCNRGDGTFIERVYEGNKTPEIKSISELYNDIKTVVKEYSIFAERLAKYESVQRLKYRRPLHAKKKIG